MRTEKSTAVLDTSVVVAGIFWKTDAHRCLVALTRRRFFIAGCPEIFSEYLRSTLKREKQYGIDPRPMLDYLEATARKVEPVHLLTPVCRDSSDEIFLAAAVAANAQFIVTHDPDLLVLTKPFGIEILRPREFLLKISK
ncbi:MAG TPA: putative toxin-antitoxin system toxin component, PIN family [Verrucomicrobiae bacterium]|jgi:putative PIN family toxin of toxin-antitoxin system